MTEQNQTAQRLLEQIQEANAKVTYLKQKTLKARRAHQIGRCRGYATRLGEAVAELEYLKQFI